MDFKEKCKNARAFIVLLAAFIALLLNIKYERELVRSLVIVIIVIIVFFAISTVAMRLIDKIRNMEGISKVDVSDSDEEISESDEESGKTEN